MLALRRGDTVEELVLSMQYSYCAIQTCSRKASLRAKKQTKRNKPETNQTKQANTLVFTGRVSLHRSLPNDVLLLGGGYQQAAHATVLELR